VAIAPHFPTSDEVVEAVTAGLDDIDPPAPDGQGFKVTDGGSADWALRKLARVRSRQAEVAQLAEKQRQAILASVAQFLEPIDEWEADELARLRGDAEFFEALLLQFHRSVLAEDERAKTVRLPHGKLVARKQKDKWDIEDDVLIEWAKSVGAAGVVRVKAEVDRAEIRRGHVLQAASNGVVVWAGEIVPGVTFAPGEVQFTVEIEEGK
jgi:hypothetical protein